MKRRTGLLVGVLFAGLLILAGVLALRPRESASAFVFSSPINGGCYIAGPNQCKIHIDPFQINLGSNTRLKEFRLMANGEVVYHFTTDVSNPPGGTSYTPSMVMQDFAATCGETYTINILGRDSGDTNLLNMGQIENVVCPSAVP